MRYVTGCQLVPINIDNERKTGSAVTPTLNLKNSEDIAVFNTIAASVPKMAPQSKELDLNDATTLQAVTSQGCRYDDIDVQLIKNKLFTEAAHLGKFTADALM